MLSDYSVNTSDYSSSDSLFKKIVTASPNLIFLFNPARNVFIYLNKRVESILGYNENEIKSMGKHVLKKIIHHDDLKDYNKNILPKINSANDKEIINFTYRFIHRNRNIIWLNVNEVIVSRRRDGTPFLVIGIANNVTAEKELSQKIKSSENKYRTLFDDAINMIHIIDKAGIILDVNKAECRKLGYSKKEMIGRPIFDFIHPDYLDLIKGRIQKVIKSKTSLIFDTKFVTKKNKHIIVEANVSPEIVNGNVVTIRAILNDITAQEHAKKIAMQNLLLNSINTILEQSLECDTKKEVAEICLNIAEKLSGSKFGFLGEINRNGKLDNIAITKRGWEECKIKDAEKIELLTNMEINGIWGAVIKNKKTYLTNSPSTDLNSSGVPEGHPELTSFLGVPLFHQNDLFGVIALANKPEGYTAVDKANIEALAGTITLVLFNKMISAELDSYKEHLEKLVKQRTSELNKINEELNKEIEVRKNIESALRTSEKRYKKIFENAPIGMYRSNSEGEILLANSFLLNMLGYKSINELVTELNASELYAKENRRREFAEIIEKNGVIHNFESELVKKDGQIISVVEDAIAIFDHADGIVYYEGIIQDITQRKKDLQTIRFLSEAIRQNPTFILMTDPEGNIEYVNPFFETLTGYKYSEVIGKNPRFLNSGEFKKHYYKKMWRHIKSGKSWTCEFHNKKKNGELFWTNAIIFPILNEDNEITNFVSVQEDITEKKKLIDELVKAKEAAERSDKLKSEFLAQISHEIRTPLSSLMSFSSLLEDEFKEQVDDDLLYAFDAIKKSGQRITRTVDLILNMSEIAANAYDYTPQNIDINDTIIDVIFYNNKHLAKSKNINLIFEKRIEPFYILADEYSLTQIISNLVDNAIKFTPEGKVEIAEYINGKNRPVIEIIDTGIGISKDYLPKIFDKFSQEEQGYTRKYDGNGLGLSLVKEYCKLNNIEIEVESKKDAGSTFRLIFPEKIIIKE